MRLKDWEERTAPAQSVQALAGRAFGAFSQIQDAMVFPIVPPSVIELGNVSGFDFYLQARGGQTHEQLLEARNQLLGMAAQSPLIASARPSGWRMRRSSTSTSTGAGPARWACRRPMSATC